MNTNTLIKETLKYLEKDKDNKPKYKFEIYNAGIANYYKGELAKLTFGLVDLEKEEERTIPVSVYTIGDLFDTVADLKQDVVSNIQALPNTIDNIGTSLKQLGFTALDNILNTIKAVVAPMEIVQTVESIYRVAKPLVDKIVNIASIKFHFENAALVAQDVLQYLGRMALSTSRNFLDRLWNILLDTPVFAVYENDNTENFAEVYSELSEAAENAIQRFVREADAIYEMIEYINGAKIITTNPSYDSYGIAPVALGSWQSDNIKSIYSDPNTRKIYIASDHRVYSVTEDYGTDLEFETKEEDPIYIIYVSGNNLHYITLGIRDNIECYIVKCHVDGEIQEKGHFAKNGGIDIIYSNPLMLFMHGYNKLYTPEGQEISSDIIAITNNIKDTCYDIENHTIYYISDNKELWQITSTEDENGYVGYYPKKLYEFEEEPYGIRYFNNTLYIIKEKDGTYYLTKIDAGNLFKRNKYEYANYTGEEKNIVWTDGNYATDGSNIFKVSNNNKLTYKYNIDSTNCVTEVMHNGTTYIVCSSGTKLFVAIKPKSDNDTIKWYEREIDTYDHSEDSITNAPDNIAGHLWYDNAYGRYLILYSQRRVYVFDSEGINRIFNFVDTREIPPLLTKEFATFDEWYDEEDEEVESICLEPVSTTDIQDSCIITSVRVMGGLLYMSLFSPLNNNTKSGIYRCSITDSEFVVDYSNPIFYSNKKTKIYSFNIKDDELYYIDSDGFYNITTHSVTDLKLREYEDGALFIDSNINLYTSKAFLESVTVKVEKTLRSLAKYETSRIPKIAATRNTMMFSDGSFVYNIIDSKNYAINYDLFQICYEHVTDNEDFDLVQSNDAAFIVSGNRIIRKLPFYSSIDSCEYGCGYYVDTAPNKWHGAAPYYFASNILNQNKNSIQRDLFLFEFKENFKVELEKLLNEIPDAFLGYASQRLREELDKIDIHIEGDDGQILNVIKNSVTQTAATSLGMYIRDKFIERIGDDSTYDTFSNAVYKACKADVENNMTKQFYDIFGEFAKSVIDKAVNEYNIGRNGLAKYLLRYYQNHKAEWAKSMTDLIDIDIVDPGFYEVPLKNTVRLTQTTYRYSYKENCYKFEFLPNTSDFNEIIRGYYDKENDKFYSDEEHTKEIDPRHKDDEGNYVDGSGKIICYYDPVSLEYYKYKLMDYVKTEDTIVVAGDDYYEKTGDNSYYYELTNDEEIEQNKMYFSRILNRTSDTSVENEKEYFEKSKDTFEYEQVTSRDYGGEYTYNVSGQFFEYNPDGSYRYIVTFIPFVPNDDDITWTFKETTDTEVVPGKIYYDANHNEIENPTGNPKEQGWYEDAGEYTGSVGDYIFENGYYKHVTDPGDKETYVVATSTPSNGILKLDSYYVDGTYTPTSDTEVSSGKEYYAESYIKAPGVLPSPSTQYYEYQYIPTTDTEVNVNKKYYKYFSYSEQTIEENGFVLAPEGTTLPRYRKVFREYDGVFEDGIDYFIKDENDNYIEAEVLDHNLGPYYFIYAMELAEDGEYVRATKATFPDIHYNKVQRATLDELSSYYERVLVEIPTPDTLEGKYIKTYTLVDNPSNAQISSYYEKENKMVPAENVVYAHDEFGTVIGIVDDRIYYKAVFTTGSYSKVENPTGNPYMQGWYEYDYVQADLRTISNPKQEGLYERIINSIAFTKVEDPSGNPKEQGWYEFMSSYSNVYDDGKVYIDLAPEEIESDFPELDEEWHNMFYNELEQIRAEASTKSYEDAKSYALSALNKIDYKYQPAWQWKDLITQSVMMLYIPKQGEQYRDIVMDSNMYPIQWNELPPNIDTQAFDYALTALLYAIKQRLISNIALLVDNGKIKCYSCVDASSVIKKIIDRNAGIWFKQGKKIKANIEKATTKEEILDALSTLQVYDETLYLLESILNDQSKLYAKYIDRIIEEQVINDNDTEVMLND